MQKLKLNDQMANKEVFAKWSHLIEIYKFENDSVSLSFSLSFALSLRLETYQQHCSQTNFEHF